jgi:hypothetical protein
MPFELHGGPALDWSLSCAVVENGHVIAFIITPLGHVQAERLTSLWPSQMSVSLPISCGDEQQTRAR